MSNARTFSEQVREHVRAGFSGLWIRSDEQDDAEATLSQLANANGWIFARWDCDRGIETSSGRVPDPDPLSAVRALPGLREEDDERPAVMVYRNLHRFMGDPQVCQALATQIFDGKTCSRHVVILAPVVEIPAELQRLIVVIEHDLPDRASLADIAERTDEETPAPTGADLDALLDAAAGLTRLEAENAFALSIVREGTISPAAVWETKTQTLKRSGLLELHRGAERFADLGGLDSLKDFGRRALDRTRQRIGRPRGLMLLGVPGTGKSAYAKALGNETGRPTLTLNIGQLMGSLVGQTEEQTRRALAIVDAMAPCVLFMDEIEKGLAGVASSGQTDSGVSSRMFGTLLTWMNDHTTDVYTVCTSNDISALPPEFIRPGRFDAVYFLDFPGPAERDLIWNMYLDRYKLDPAQARPEAKQWTGAEIRACCERAELLDLPLTDAARYVVPVSSTAAEKITGLRRWATGRALDAHRPDLYRWDAPAEPATAATAEKPRKARRIQRPDANPDLN